MSVANDDDDDDRRQSSASISWDEVCVNPHESFMEEGRAEGHQAGLQAGFEEGFALGRSKGVEFGMELGFMRGALKAVEEALLSNRQEDSSNTRLGRIRKVADELRRGIDEFPSPDEVFRSVSSSGDGSAENDSELQQPVESLDIMGKMQRLRAKFKVLMVLFKIPRFSLKQVLADDAPDGTKDGGMSSTEAKPPADEEW